MSYDCRRTGMSYDNCRQHFMFEYLHIIEWKSGYYDCKRLKCVYNIFIYVFNENDKFNNYIFVLEK